jgi:hypothetical protein
VQLKGNIARFKARQRISGRVCVPDHFDWFCLKKNIFFKQKGGPWLQKEKCDQKLFVKKKSRLVGNGQRWSLRQHSCNPLCHGWSDLIQLFLDLSSLDRHPQECLHNHQPKCGCILPIHSTLEPKFFVTGHATDFFLHFQKTVSMRTTRRW